MDFGKKLRDAREALGFSLDDVEQETKIRKLYIKAIEDEKFGILPPKVYATGFVKRYAKLLKLDENETVEEFKALAFSNDEIEEEHHNYSDTVFSDKKIEESHFNVKNLLAAILFVVVVVWAGNALVGYLANRGTEPAEPNKTSVVEKTPQKHVEKAGSKTAIRQMDVKITANQKCWVQISADNTMIFEGTMMPAEQKEVRGKEKINIRAGNAGGISLILNGKNVGALGTNGQVVEYELFKDGTVKKI